MLLNPTIGLENCVLYYVSASCAADGTDVYTNDRTNWRESEPAIDYSAGLICSLMGYAALPDGSFDDPTCDVRTPLTGRSTAS